MPSVIRTVNTLDLKQEIKLSNRRKRYFSLDKIGVIRIFNK
jgi:hypothetical protein